MSNVTYSKRYYFASQIGDTKVYWNGHCWQAEEDEAAWYTKDQIIHVRTIPTGYGNEIWAVRVNSLSGLAVQLTC